MLNRTSRIEVSAEDHKDKVTLLGCARKCEGGCSVLHSSHWDRLKDLPQISGSGQVFFLERDLVHCGISPPFPLGTRKDVGSCFHRKPHKVTELRLLSGLRELDRYTLVIENGPVPHLTLSAYERSAGQRDCWSKGAAVKLAST